MLQALNLLMAKLSSTLVLESGGASVNISAFLTFFSNFMTIAGLGIYHKPGCTSTPVSMGM